MRNSRTRLSRGCSGPTTCSTSPSTALVFLAWFPEEMRLQVAASPPAPRHSPEEQRGSAETGDTQPRRKVSTRSQPGAEAVLPQPGGVWELGRRSIAKGTPFYTPSSVPGLEPRYPNSCGMKQQKAGQGLEHPGLVEGVPAPQQGEAGAALKSLPTKTIS